MQTLIQPPLYQQIDEKFKDPDYLVKTRREMGQPHCLSKPMYVVGKKNAISPITRKAISIAQTILGTLTVIPAVYWTMRSCVEFICFPVSSRILRAIMQSARDTAISPPKNDLSHVTDAIKVVTKITLLSLAFVASGSGCGLGTLALRRIFLATFAGAGLYHMMKRNIVRNVAKVIQEEYANHIEMGPKHLRMSVMVDRERIDTYIVMSHDQIAAGQRWILATNGNSVPAETVVSDLIQTPNLKNADGRTMLSELSTKLKANVVTYNYGGCLESEGNLSAEKAAKVYQTMKAMLEDPQGLAAQEIIFYGHSIGGAAQAQGLKGLQAEDFKKEIKYVCVKDRTFADSDVQLQSMFPGRFGKVLRLFTQHLGWNINIKDQCEELYNNKIPQANLNSQYYDHVISDPLIKKFNSVDKDETLVFTQDILFLSRKDAHMHAPYTSYCNKIADNIRSMLN